MNALLELLRRLFAKLGRKSGPTPAAAAAVRRADSAPVKCSPAGIALIKQFEGCHLTAYPDPKTGGDPWTVGWGATGPGIERGTVWTKSQADARLLADVSERERAVLRAVTAQMTQGQFDALVSILFNVGAGSSTRDGIIRLKSGNPSTLLRKFNAGDVDGAEAEFLKWVSAGSNVEKGLRRRRQAEVALYRGAS